MEYYRAVKRDKISRHAKTQMNLKNIMQSEKGTWRIPHLV